MTRKKQNLPLSQAEGFKMISEYFQSGMGCSEYYTSHGVSEWQFYKWKRLYLQAYPQLGPAERTGYEKDTPRFACLEIKEAPLSASSCFLPSIEIQYPNGLRLCIAEGLKEISWLKALVTLSPESSCSR